MLMSLSRISRCPTSGGLDLLKAVKDNYPETELIIITGFGSIGSAIEAMKKGAFDYITKPFDLDELTRKMNVVTSLSWADTRRKALDVISATAY